MVFMFVHSGGDEVLNIPQGKLFPWQEATPYLKIYRPNETLSSAEMNKEKLWCIWLAQEMDYKYNLLTQRGCI